MGADVTVRGRSATGRRGAKTLAVQCNMSLQAKWSTTKRKTAWLGRISSHATRANKSPQNGVAGDEELEKGSTRTDGGER